MDIYENLLEVAETIRLFNSRDNLALCRQFADKLVELYRTNGKALACGNGGSHCDAMHFAEELTGRYKKDRVPLGAIALGDPSHVTCTGNDFGFNEIFSRQVQGLGRQNDILLAISTSGNSQNVINAVHTAKHRQNMYTVGLLGNDGGQLKDLVDIAIIVPSDNTSRIQEVHTIIIHSVIEMVEEELFP